jgi:thiamine biosynthesis lipoprotein
MKTRRSFLRTAAAAGLALALPHPLRAEQIFGGHAFGSSWRVVAPASADASAIRQTVARIVAETDAEMSPFRANSAISHFNRSEPGGWQDAPATLCEVAGAALKVAAATGGAFDPTIGPLVSRFGFGPVKGSPGGLGALWVRADGLCKTRAGVTLDLCGIAKGHALDRIAEALRPEANLLIELGGEVRALGVHPAGRPWQVAVERPGAGFAVQRIVAPGVLALATSGTAANGYDEGGRRLSHLIDPRMKRPLSGALASVTVLDASAMRADALSTALMVLGPERGVALARRLRIPALFQTSGREVMTGDFERYVVA